MSETYFSHRKYKAIQYNFSCQSMRRQLRKNLVSQTPSHLARKQSPPSSDKRRKREYLYVFAAVLSLLATLLTLAGYGVALSAIQFNLPQEVLFSSPLDLLSLSFTAVFYFFEDLSIAAFWADRKRLFFETSWAPLVLFAVLFGCVLYWKYQFRLPNPRKRMPNPANWLRFERETSIGALALKLATGTLTVWTTFHLLSALAVAVAMFVAYLLVMAPLTGFDAGQKYIKEYVILPEQCAPLRNVVERRAALSKKPQPADNANCVLIRNERGLCEQGRVVFATTSAMILFDPKTGGVFRVPTKDAVIEAVGALGEKNSCEPAPPGKSRAPATRPEAAQAPTKR